MKNDIAKLPEGVVIRPVRQSDAQGLAALGAMPVYLHGTLRIPFQRESDAADRIQGLAKNETVIVADCDGTIVGEASLKQFSGRRAHAASLGIGIRDDWHGKGVGSALLGNIIDAADRWLNINRIELTVFSDNATAIRLYEKAGFEKEGLLRQFAFRDGKFVDVYCMARIRPNTA